tara:strand:+ start:64 stop:756 length:693 start_codon:yes stop_codon:yes gene_type:complete
VKKILNEPTLSLIKINKQFYQGNKNINVLRGIDFELFPGEIVALLGPSGSGKSTLLQISGLLDSPDSGTIYLNGQQVQSASDSVRTKLRLSYIGFVYQFHNLFPDFSSVENVILPQMIAGNSSTNSRKRSIQILNDLGLNDRLDHKPGQLSGGEQQRCAIARALANNPKLLLADEPTGNLDMETAESVFFTLKKVVKSQKLSALLATHNQSLASKTDKVVELKDGKLIHH